MIRHELWKHKRAYTVLVIGLVICTLLFLAAWPNHFWQRLIAVLIGVFYLTWGTVTHLHAERLTKHIVYEYTTVSVLASLMLFLVTL